MSILDIETLPTAGEAKMAKPLIFLATVGTTFNRHLVDIAQVVSSQSSANIAVSSVRCVRESVGLLEIFHVLLPATFLSDHPYSTFHVGIENGPGGAR